MWQRGKDGICALFHFSKKCSQGATEQGTSSSLSTNMWLQSFPQEVFLISLINSLSYFSGKYTSSFDLGWRIASVRSWKQNTASKSSSKLHCNMIQFIPVIKLSIMYKLHWDLMRISIYSHPLSIW